MYYITLSEETGGVTVMLIMVYCDFNKLGGNLTTWSGKTTQGMRYTYLRHVNSL